MRFSPTSLDGVFLIELEKQEDSRGWFARSFCRQEFSKRGLCAEIVQENISHNRRRGTLRGLHYQQAPYPETKLVRCEQGAIHDVIVDLRPESSTFLHWAAFELTATNGRMLYVPKGIAHGFQTLADESRVHYQMGEYFHPEVAAGVRYDDPAFGITWPLSVTEISSRDAGYPLWKRAI